MGRAYDTTASYQALAVKLAVLTLFAAALMLTMPEETRGKERCLTAIP
jgi:hypothetical protein